MSKTTATFRVILSTAQPTLHPPVPCAFRPPRASSFISLTTRSYATHRSTKSSSTSDSKSQDLHSDLLGKLGQGSARSAAGAAGQESVGPFPLGVGASGRAKGWKRWGELGLGGKLVRTTQQTGNLTVILVGGALFVLLTVSLTTELFAKNSPSVLYSQAVDMIRASDALNAHLLPPLKFTHSPHSSAPVRGSPPIAHTYVRNPTSGRDHLLITFWVHGRGRDEPDPSVGTWGWLKTAWQSIEKAGQQGLFAVGLSTSPADPEEKEIELELHTGDRAGTSVADHQRDKDQGWLGSIFGGWTSLRAGAVNVAGKISTRGLPPPGTYKIGEARAEYVKNASGQYNLLTLAVEVPSSNAPHPGRALVFQSPEAETEGLLGKRIR